MKRSRAEKGKRVLKGFARRLRALRTQRQLTQRELAQRIGVHFLQVSRYERGTTLPALETIVEMTRVLRVPADTLLFGETGDRSHEELPIRNVTLLERFQDLESLPFEDQKTAIKLIDALIASRRVEALVESSRRSA
jgi:transcriptional regulator with XRE-family HTH domain